VKNAAKLIFIIFVLFVAACQKSNRESSETAAIGDQVNINHMNPVFVSTYLGGNGNEFCEAIALDGDGNIYVAGNTRSPDFPTSEGAYNRNPMGKSDVIVAKFDNNLETLLAATLIGGSEDECAYAMLFDPRGFVYVAGYTSSKNFPTTELAYDKNYNGGEGDAFILKLDKDLRSLVSSTYLGGSGAEDDWRSPEMVQDEEGNIYIAGNTTSDDFPSTSGVFQEKYNGGARDVFLAKFDSDLTKLVASTFLGGSGDESLGRSLCIDNKTNEIFVGGYTFSPDFPTSQDAYGRVVSGNLDGFVSKFDMDLKELTASTILDSGWIYCMMIHDSGDIYVGGHAANRLPTTIDAFHDTFDKASDQGFISRLSNDLSELKSSTVIPGSYATGGGRICSLNLCQSPDGQIFSSGWVRPIDFPVTPGVYDETQNGNGDTYIMKMNSDLSEVLLSTFIGGSRSERWNRMTTDEEGNIYLASYTLSSDFPTSKDAAFTNFSEVITDDEENLNTSPRDAFIIKIGENLSAEAIEEFHEASKRDQVKVMRELLSKNRNWLEKRDRYQRTPLHSAARYGASSAAKFLLDRGAEVGVKDESGNTPLHLSSIYGHHQIVDLLIRKGADFGIANAQGFTPLYLAALYGNPQSTKLLLAHGAETDTVDAEGNTPLHIAALYRNSENLEAILEVNPETESINTEGNTPLLIAVSKPDNEKAVESLLRSGADINTTNPAGRNALLVCVDSSQKEYIGLLVSKGIDINSQDGDGNTSLHYLFSKVLANKLYIPMCKEIARPLLEKGADPSIRNKAGKAPLDLAVESGERELTDLLKSAKPSIR
jgi:ankyrin repeat protein